MKALLLAIAMMSQPEAMINRAKMQRLAASIIKAAKRYQLDPVLLAAVVMTETGGRLIVARGRGKGKLGCDVGPAQIHVPGCDRSKVKELLDIDNNVKRAAYVLRFSKRKCSENIKKRGCNGSLWGRYNPGSKTWWPKVRDMKARIVEAIETRRAARWEHSVAN